MNKKNLFKKALDTAGEEPANIENVILVNREQHNSIKKEVRSKKAHTYLRPSEHENFLKLIGRESFSDMVRELILLASGQKTEAPKKRNLILALIEKSKNG